MDPRQKDITFAACIDENEDRKDSSSVTPSEDDKSKSQMSFIREDIIKKAKQVLGTDVMFVYLNDQVRRKALSRAVERQGTGLDLRTGEEERDDGPQGTT